jgi:hypothetical protein
MTRPALGKNPAVNSQNAHKWRRLVFCILDREDREDRKEYNFSSLAAGQLDSVMDREEVAHHIVDSAVAIHTALGPGLLESVYRLPD